jgi:hypothetical protein
MNLIYLFLGLTLWASLGFSKGLPIYRSPQAGIVFLNRAPDQWTTTKLLRQRLSSIDSNYMLTKAEQLKIDLKKKLELKILSPLQFQIKGIEGIYEALPNGKGLKFRGIEFHRDSKLSFREHVEKISEQLMSSKKTTWWSVAIPVAYAGNSNSDGYQTATILYYLDVWSFNDDFNGQYMVENVPEIGAAFRNMKKKIEKISCTSDYQLDIKYTDGSTSNLTWDGVQGAKARLDVADNGKKVQLDNPASDKGVVGGAMFYFCQKLNGNRQYAQNINTFFNTYQNENAAAVAK